MRPLDYTPREMEILGALHPALKSLCRQHRERCAARNILVRLTSGYRDPEHQRALYAKGRDSQGAIVEPAEVVTFTRPGMSWHNYGLAYDVVLVRPDGKSITWDDVDLDGDEVRDWLEIGDAGESLGLTWGGRWKKLRDCPHFEHHPRLTIMEARKMMVVPPAQFENRGGVA